MELQLQTWAARGFSGKHSSTGNGLLSHGTWGSCPDMALMHMNQQNFLQASELHHGTAFKTSTAVLAAGHASGQAQLTGLPGACEQAGASTSFIGHLE